MTGESIVSNDSLNPDAIIWRYVDLAKFLDLLERRHLYFPRLDALDDPFEGVVQKNIFAPLPANQSNRPSHHAQLYRLFQEGVFVSCWHANAYESEAMWKLYSREGIAIRSTIGRLKSGLKSTDDLSIHFDAVKYLDYSASPIIVSDNGLDAVMSKRISYEHEREIRAAILNFPLAVSVNGEDHVDLGNPDHPKGLYIRVDIETLVERVYVSPKRPAWFRELVHSLVKRYGLADLEVVASSLDERPDLT